MGKGNQRSGGNSGIPGLGNIPGLGEVPEIDFDDAELEAELGDILGVEKPKQKAKPKGGKQAFSSVEEWSNFDKMVAGCMDDIGDDDDEDLDDPDLLAELIEVADEPEPVMQPVKQPPPIPARKEQAPAPVPPVSPAKPAESSSKTNLLTLRVEEYKTAALNAKKSGDKASAVKFMGEFKALKQCADNNGAGFADPGPPSGAPPTQTASQSSSGTPPNFTQASTDGSLLDALRQRRHLFFLRVQSETVASKTRRYNKQLKQYDDAIKAIEAGKKVDVSGLPVPAGAPPLPGENDEGANTPSETSPQSTIPPQPHQPEIVQPQPVAVPPPQPAPVVEQQQQPNSSSSTTSVSPPKTVLEGLLQRREMMLTRSKGETGAKARRLDRQTKAYDPVIRSYKGGKAVDFSSLVVPPGAPDMPGEKQMTLDQRMNQADESGDSQASTPNQSPVKPVAQPSQATTSKCQRQLEFLQNRHEEFKKAAIQARDNGNKQEAMSFMKTMKAIQDMINHTKNGLPCDISKVPPAPIPSQPALGTIQGSQKRTPAHATLLNDLEEQLKKAKTLSKTFTALNDLDRASTMDKWASNTFRDITTLKNLTAQGRTVPDVIWETRRVKSIRLFAYIEPNQCEIKIENLLEIPKELHNESIFVQVLFPYPREPECIFRTAVLRAAQNTKVDFKNSVAIDRKKSAFKRALERKPIQFEVFKKGGIFSSDKSILKSAMMLTEFETECEIRKVIPLLANKKPVAKIQVRVRLREPMEKAQVVEEEIQWAVLDSVKAKKPAAQKPAANTSASSKKPDLPKMKPKSVLKYEISVELGFAEKAKQLRNREKIEQHTQKLQSLQDELSRTREYAKSHPSNYKLICANYVERCMSFLNMAQEQGWTDRIAEVSAKIQHSKGELATLSS